MESQEAFRLSLAVTADDFGLAAGVDEGILQLAKLGRVTGASVMCHRGAVLDRVGELRESGVATGIHLVFVEEEALLGREALGGLVGEDGRLPSDYRALFARVVLRPWILRALVAEAEAQVRRFLELGLRLAFINSHQHVHLFPPIWAALRGLFAAHPGSAVRTARRSKIGADRGGLLALSSRLSWSLAPLRGRPLLRPIGVGCAGSLDGPSLEEELGALGASPDDPLELVVHPGVEDSALRDRYAHWEYHWDRERAFLASEELMQTLRKHSVRLRGRPA